MKIINSLLANTQFVNLAKILVNSDKGTPTYLATYDALNALLKSLGVTVRVGIEKSDGGWWYSSKRTPDERDLNINQNTRPEIFLAVNYAFRNPICNKKLYPLDLQSSVCSGYGFTTRQNSIGVPYAFTAKTYKPSASPLSTDVFTLVVVQDA